MICDHQKGVPLALLPDRLPETVTAWLKRHPFIQVVSRDGYTAFRQAITQANPAIHQVYDRWHFIRNAKKQVDVHLATLVPTSITWMEPAAEQTAIPLTARERAASERQKRKWSLIQEIQKQHADGKNISRLSREYQLDRRTIQKYLDLQTPPMDRRPRAKPIDGYSEEVTRLEQAGHTIRFIHQTIQGKGYEGTYSAVRALVESRRKERKYGAVRTDSIPRRRFAAVIWKQKRELNAEDAIILHRGLSLYPCVGPFYESVQALRASITARDYPGFLEWLAAQLSDRASPFLHYARRLRSDLQAVRNAFTHSYSNGLLEGQINRLKTIKRITYGRASLKLLEKRVLYRHNDILKK
ncbi:MULTISPECIES: transposase [unclassified Sporosarcina]|uniref:transposase n=1 Tax=unclassified Sporosarcina TaxID=2647733 RepID=UPI001E5F57E0|nr:MULTISPECIES: transposase [unclassified Sporosarcina]